jgi:hypothetical protein
MQCVLRFSRNDAHLPTFLDVVGTQTAGASPLQCSVRALTSYQDVRACVYAWACAGMTEYGRLGV